MQLITDNCRLITDRLHLEIELVEQSHQGKGGSTDEEKKSDFDGGYYYRKYGDLIIWKELLRRVTGTKINTLFIEDEKKKDWFSERGGKKLAPVLYEEYDQATNALGKIEVCNFLAFLHTIP